MIFVTHDQIEAMTLADRIAIMHHGVIQQLDTPREVYRRPQSRYVAGFVGSPSMNFVPGTFRVKEGASIFVTAHGESVSLAPYAFAGPRLPEEGATIELGIRPETLSFAPHPESNSEVTASFSIIEPMGGTNLNWGELGDTPIAVLSGFDQVARTGAPIPLYFDMRQASIFDAAGNRL